MLRKTHRHIVYSLILNSIQEHIAKIYLLI